MEDVQIAVEAAVWSELGETEDQRIEQVLDAIDRMRKSDTDVIEIEGIEPDVIPELVARSNSRFERQITGLAAMMGGMGCPCSKCRAKAANGQDSAAFNVYFGKEAAKVRGEVERKAAELGMVDGESFGALVNSLGGARGLARGIVEAIKSRVESGDFEPGVNVLEIDASTGDIRAVPLSEVEDGGVGQNLQDMLEAANVVPPKNGKRTIH